jgi:hypothetical protein
MAYSRKNHLKKVLKVQEIYLEYTRKGCTNEYIFETLIRPHFFISRSTFYEYLAIPAAKELKGIKSESYV